MDKATIIRLFKADKVEPGVVWRVSAAISGDLLCRKVLVAEVYSHNVYVKEDADEYGILWKFPLLEFLIMYEPCTETKLK